MLKREEAEKLLKQEQTTNWLEHCLEAIARDLSHDLRPVAYALLGRDERGEPVRAHDQEAQERHHAAVEQAYARLGELDSSARLAVFTALFPVIGATVEAAWQLLGRLPYQTGWQRKPFRLRVAGSATTAARRKWLGSIVHGLGLYRTKDVAWLAAWAPYLAGYNGQGYGILFAGAIDAGGSEGEAVFEMLAASARGEHPIGAMGRHVSTGLLAAARPDGWDLVGKLLLAAQREEGLRQVILEAADEAHPEAFRRILRLILDHDLVRFSAAIRAVGVWLGFAWDVEVTRTVRDTLAAVSRLLGDAELRRETLARGDARQVYLALWCTAFEDAEAAVTAAAPLLADDDPARRLAAVHLVRQLGLAPSRACLVPLLRDTDLRVAVCAFGGVQPGHGACADGELFERLEELLPRLPEKARTVESGIWPWLTIHIDAQQVADALVRHLGRRSPRSLIPYLPRMSSWGRWAAADKLASLHEWDDQIRNVIFGMARDRSSWVRDHALGLIARHPITSRDALPLEGMLMRKGSEGRREVLELLLAQEDNGVFASAERLLAARHAPQRLGGLGLLREMAQARRDIARCQGYAGRYSATRASLTENERTLLEAICALGRPHHLAPTLENALGLMRPAERTRPIAPRARPTAIDTPAARACLRLLDDLVETHRATPLSIKTWTGGEERLLGNMSRWFPEPDPRAPRADGAAANLPLADLWHTWERERPPESRDPDGLELVRALLLLRGTRAMNRADVSTIRDQIRHRQIIQAVLRWLLYLQDPPPALALDLLLDAAEAALASRPRGVLDDATQIEASETEALKQQEQWRTRLADDESFALLRQYMAWQPTMWTGPRHVRYWRLLHWLDQPLPRMPRLFTPLPVILAAHREGDATEADILDRLVAPAHNERGYGYDLSDLAALSARAPHPLLGQYPVLKGLVPALRARIVDVELTRGDMPTVATRLAHALRYAGGTSVFVRILKAMASDRIARGYLYEDGSRAMAFSHLLRVTYPGPDDTLDEFAHCIEGAGIATERLVAAAVFAPQWARHVERYLDWPGLEDAIWWTRAHTHDTYWSVEEQLRKVWQAETAERTPLAAQDLLDGAVDVAWFRRGYRALGQHRWDAVYEAAKYASGGSGHARARLFADAMLGAVSSAELGRRIDTSRNPDAVRALDLVPLPEDPAACEAELRERYGAIQEFARGSRAFGAQRRASEGLAARIAMDNLARTAGYADPIRLQWAMEARLAADLRDGALHVERDGVLGTLSLHPLTAEPLLAVSRSGGRALKALPPRVKKHPEVVALIERKREIERQVARMRGALETAMCRGDRFTEDEVAALLAHPVLARLLRNLIFVQDGGDGSPGVLGYPEPRADGDGAAPRVVFRAHDGSLRAAAEAAGMLRLAHPHDLLASGDWHAWQHDCFAAERIQPIKQVFRELYVLTQSEQRQDDAAISCRYSGQQVQPRQAMALFGQRGWVTHPVEGVRRTFHAEGISAAVAFDQGIFTPADVEGLTVGGVLFTRRDGWRPIPLASVPPRLFSEVMRDVDLVVSVAHSGGVDPEATASTVEMRAALVRETCDLLNLGNVAIRSAHALIEGRLGSYSVHLGSAVVHRQPGGALCIVPVHGQHRGRLFLPFADDDPRTAEVVSKVALLARDADIKDPSILEQIL